MKRILPLLLLLPATALAGSGSGSRFPTILAEARQEVQGVRQALSEVQRGGNLDETCFRVGGLYLTLRHELAEEVAGGEPLTSGQQATAAKLIEDSKALTSFCGDVETAQQDPSLAPLARGDVAGLKAALSTLEQSLR